MNVLNGIFTDVNNAFALLLWSRMLGKKEKIHSKTLNYVNVLPFTATYCFILSSTSNKRNNIEKNPSNEISLCVCVYCVDWVHTERDRYERKKGRKAQKISIENVFQEEEVVEKCSTTTNDTNIRLDPINNSLSSTF